MLGDMLPSTPLGLLKMQPLPQRRTLLPKNANCTDSFRMLRNPRFGFEVPSFMPHVKRKAFQLSPGSGREMKQLGEDVPWLRIGRAVFPGWLREPNPSCSFSKTTIIPSCSLCRKGRCRIAGCVRQKSPTPNSCREAGQDPGLHLCEAKTPPLKCLRCIHGTPKPTSEISRIVLPRRAALFRRAPESTHCRKQGRTPHPPYTPTPGNPPGAEPPASGSARSFRLAAALTRLLLRCTPSPGAVSALRLLAQTWHRITCVSQGPQTDVSSSVPASGNRKRPRPEAHPASPAARVGRTLWWQCEVEGCNYSVYRHPILRGHQELAVSILRLTMALVTRLASTILAPRPRRLEAKLTKPKLSRPGLKPFVPDRSLERLLRRSLVTPCFLACLG